MVYFVDTRILSWLYLYLVITVEKFVTALFVLCTGGSLLSIQEKVRYEDRRLQKGLGNYP